jgi:predicted nucleic acid-binding protein
MTVLPRVLLDTTAVIGEGFGTSAPFRHLLRDAKDGRVEVLVPETVMAETVFVYRRELVNRRKALKKMPTLLRAAGRDPDYLDQGALIGATEKTLRQRLLAAGVKILEAPEFDADEMVRRIHDRRKPTKDLSFSDGEEQSEQGEGFRDQLIWEHVRTAAEDGPLIFITDNTRDFGHPKSRANGHAELHEDLVEDLEADKASGRSPGDVTLVLDVKAFVQHYLRKEDVIADVSQLLSGRAGELLRLEVAHRLAHDGLLLEGYVPEMPVQGDVEEATLASFGNDSTIELVDAYLESEEDDPRVYGISAEIAGEGGVDWYVSAPTPWDLEEFSASVEGDTSGGGFIPEFENSAVVISVSGNYSPSEESWSEVDFEAARQPESERTKRSDEHAVREFTRAQELGMAPSDEEIESFTAEQERPKAKPKRPKKPRKKKRST